MVDTDSVVIDFSTAIVAKSVHISKFPNNTADTESVIYYTTAIVTMSISVLSYQTTLLTLGVLFITPQLL